MFDIFFNAFYGKIYETIESSTFEKYEYTCEYGRVWSLFLKRPIPILIAGKLYYDITTPYGYGGPLIVEATNKEKLISSFQKAFSLYCLENEIVSEFIRFHLFDNNDVRVLFDGEVVCVSENLYVDTRRPEADIWSSFEYKVRKNVKKAVGYGLTVQMDHTGEKLDDFLSIYYKTMERNNATEYYYFPKLFFERICQDLTGHYTFFHVFDGDQMISTELVLHSETYAYSFLGGTRIENQAMRPNDLLKHEIIRWCERTKRAAFILGGGYTKDDGIYRYKKAFAGDGIVPFFVGKKIYNPEIYEELVLLRRKTGYSGENRDFFPLYRA